MCLGLAFMTGHGTVFDVLLLCYASLTRRKKHEVTLSLSYILELFVVQYH
jgi:hypothetical protein